MTFNLHNLHSEKPVIKVSLDLIKENEKNPYDKAEQEAKVQFLTEVILKDGLTNPIHLEIDGDGMYLINKGHNRTRAFRRLLEKGYEQFNEIDAVIVNFENRAEAFRSMMQDNASQKERSPKDKLREVKLYLDEVLQVTRYKEEFKGLATKTIIAIDLGMGETTVGQCMRIARSKEYIYEAVLNETLTITNAYEIAGIKDTKLMRKVFNYANGKNLTQGKLKKIIANDGRVTEKKKKEITEIDWLKKNDIFNMDGACLEKIIFNSSMIEHTFKTDEKALYIETNLINQTFRTSTVVEENKRKFNQMRILQSKKNLIQIHHIVVTMIMAEKEIDFERLSNIANETNERLVKIDESNNDYGNGQ